MNNVLRIGLLCVSAFSAPLLTHAGDVSDGAGFFSLETREKANQAIREIEKKSGHDIHIETFATVPNGRSEEVAKMSKEDRDKFFSNWEHERAEETKARGLFILICKSPAHVRLWVGNPLQLAGFNKTQAQTIRESLVKNLKAKEYDKALTETVSELNSVFAAVKPVKRADGAVGAQPIGHRADMPAQHHAHTAPVPQQSSMSGLLWVAAIIIGGIFLFSMISRMFGGGAPQQGYGPQGYGQPGYGPPGMGYGPAYGPGGGGGGFMRSLAGGIFGAMAGNWIYDQFSGHQAHGSDSSWSNHDSNAGGNLSDDANGGSGFSGGTDFGGGDFGGDSGGDSGGSDFGGGDSGGDF